MTSLPQLDLWHKRCSVHIILFLFWTKSSSKCSLQNKKGASWLHCISCSSAVLHSTSSSHLKTYFQPLNVLASVCRDASIICRRTLVEQILISCLLAFHADLHMKQVTVQRTGTPLQPGTQVINECLWVHAENIAQVCSRVWVFAVIATTASELIGSFTFFIFLLPSSKQQGQPGVLGYCKKWMDVKFLFLFFFF